MRAWRLAMLPALLGSAGCSATKMLGEIDGNSSVKAVKVDDERFGVSGSAPGVLEIVVDDAAGSPGGVGRKVKKIFFPNDPKLIFNVAFSCGAPCPCRALYADPTSIWFNVFFGYYQIDVAQQAWKRPFGYYVSPKKLPVVSHYDILRIGKADWNYFSNYMYGVPEAEVKKYNSVDTSKGTFDDHRGVRVKIGNTYWDHIVVDGVEVVSAYVSGRDNKQLAQPDVAWTPLWRTLFGPSQPADGFPNSFIPTLMKAEIFMSYRTVESDEDLGAPAYSTLIFGATINTDYPDWGENAEFLELQVASIKDVIEADYADAGFASANH